MYDYEYSSAFIEKLLDESFVATHSKLFGPFSPLDKNLLDLWNRYLGWDKSIRVSPQNVALLAARKVMDGEFHLASSALQDDGMDAITLRLQLSTSAEGVFSALSDFTKMALFAFRLAEANERAVESTFFTYLIANRKFSVLKEVIVQTGMIVFGLYLAFVG